MAISTYHVSLCLVGDNYTDVTQLVKITSYPDLGQPANGLEKTTTSDSARNYIKGIGETPSELTFGANYVYSDYLALLDLVGEEKRFAILFQYNSQDANYGIDGMFAFSGYLDVYVNGGGVNEVCGMSISISPSSEIKRIDRNFGETAMVRVYDGEKWVEVPEQRIQIRQYLFALRRYYVATSQRGTCYVYDLNDDPNMEYVIDYYEPSDGGAAPYTWTFYRPDGSANILVHYDPDQLPYAVSE